MTQKLLTLTVVGMFGLATAAGYQLVQSRIAADVYRDRLSQLSDRYESLRGQYNEAIRKTAVTELLVEGGKLSVIVRNNQGVVKRVPTPYDPASEVYVDYVVLDNRLWIRRVFTENVAPSEGVTISPDLAKVDWDSEKVRHGKAVYSQLEEGRWRITVTGDGALGLAKAEGPTNPNELRTAPRLGEFKPVEHEVDQQIDQVGWSDIATHLLGWGGGEAAK